MTAHSSVSYLYIYKNIKFYFSLGTANVITGPQKSWWSMIKTYMSLRNYSPLGMMTQNRAACGYHLGHLSHTADEVRWVAQHLMDLYKEGKIKPKIDSVWAFEEVGVVCALFCQFKVVLIVSQQCTNTYVI